MAVAKNVVVLAATPAASGQAAAQAASAATNLVRALDLRTGRLLWQHELPSEPVDWGVAIDRDGRVLVSLRDGRVLCFAGE